MKTALKSLIVQVPISHLFPIPTTQLLVCPLMTKNEFLRWLIICRKVTQTVTRRWLILQQVFCLLSLTLTSMRSVFGKLSLCQNGTRCLINQQQNCFDLIQGSYKSRLDYQITYAELRIFNKRMVPSVIL